MPKAKTPEVFWVIPMGNHMSKPLGPLALLATCKDLWEWHARDLQRALLKYVQNKLSLAQDIWSRAISHSEQGALLSSCAYPQGQLLDYAQEIQKLSDYQENLGRVEAVFQVEGLEYKGEAVLDFTFTPDDKLTEWMPKYLGYMQAHADSMGTIHESKSEAIPVGRGYPTDNDEFRAYMAPLVALHEKDGWEANLREGHNFHRSKGGTYEVFFNRRVPTPTWPKE